MNVVALSYFAAKAAGHGQTAVQKGHAETPAKLRSGLTLQTRETPESTTTSAHVRATVTDACGPGA